MKLIKDNQIVILTDEFVIGIYKNSGWEEVKEQPKKESLKKDESEKPTKIEKSK